MKRPKKTFGKSMVHIAPKVGAEKKKRLSVVLFGAGIAFWPLFAGLTVLEEKGGVAWLHTEREFLWLPIAAAALVSVAIAPLFSERRFFSKIVRAACAIFAFVAVYGVVVLAGISHLGWDD